MGHTRLGYLPTSRRWRQVVAALSGEGREASSEHQLLDEIDLIAISTLEAAQAGVESAINDVGFRYSFYLLTQLVLAARETKWEKRLAELGVNPSETNSILNCQSKYKGSWTIMCYP